jgi:hypothetical protein
VKEFPEKHVDEHPVRTKFIVIKKTSVHFDIEPVFYRKRLGPLSFDGLFVCDYGIDSCPRYRRPFLVHHGPLFYFRDPGDQDVLFQVNEGKSFFFLFKKQRKMDASQQTARGRLVRTHRINTPTPQHLKPYVLGDFGVQGTHQVLQQVTQQKKKQQNVRPICPITNETIPKGRLYVADCLHAFDLRAMTEWVVERGHLTCPLCRAKTVGFHVPLTSRNYVGNRHVNQSTGTKGGWVACTATVSPTAFIGVHCMVGDEAQVLDNAALRGHALVMENAIVKKNASIEGRSAIADHACVTDDAVVKGQSIVGGYTRIGGQANINNSVILGRVRIKGDTKVENSVMND